MVTRISTVLSTREAMARLAAIPPTPLPAEADLINAALKAAACYMNITWPPTELQLRRLTRFLAPQVVVEGTPVSREDIIETRRNAGQDHFYTLVFAPIPAAECDLSALTCRLTYPMYSLGPTEWHRHELPDLVITIAFQSAEAPFRPQIICVD